LFRNEDTFKRLLKKTQTQTDIVTYEEDEDVDSVSDSLGGNSSHKGSKDGDDEHLMGGDSDVSSDSQSVDAA
jgi:hypothetical protein